ncbi:MAG: YlbF family regulator [Spirochaeta sp.]|nr:YlbF family regulator [Spirochaeta sp.]
MSTSTDTTQGIQAAARKFAEAVAHTKTYKEFEQANDAMEQDKEAKDLLSQFEVAQQMAQMSASWGGESQNEQNLAALQDKIAGHATLSRYFKAQESLVGELKQLDEYMTTRLGFDFAEMTKPAGGCC